MPNKQTIEDKIRQRADDLGFNSCRITKAQLPKHTGERLENAVAAGWHGTMGWLETTMPRRKEPRAMWPDAKSAIVLGLNYGPEEDPLKILNQHEKAAISVYAQNRDYHDLIKGRLKEIAGWFASNTGNEVKVFVDTAPLMEKPLAEQAGVGWQGKHTNLVSREYGSWLFLGTILTDAKLTSDEMEIDHCGSCTACLDICPTNAFPAPYQLDARRCISYLTIEHKGPIDRDLRAAMGNRIFGCDDCLAICPWNKYAQKSKEAKLIVREDLRTPNLVALAALDDAGFRKKFSGSPVKRIGRNRFLRNVLIAIGNSGNPELADSLIIHLDDDDSVVRGAAVWALSRLLNREELVGIRDKQAEVDNDVLDEWSFAIGE